MSHIIASFHYLDTGVSLKLDGIPVSKTQLIQPMSIKFTWQNGETSACYDCLSVF